MSIDLTYGAKWESCKLYTDGTTGTPTNSISGDTLTCQSVFLDSAKATKHVQVRAGEVVKLTVWARIVAGTDAGIAIDYPTGGTLRTIQKIESKEWHEYSVSAFIPANAPEDSYCLFQIGVFGRYDGTAEFKSPRIEKLKSLIGTTQTLAMALIYFDSVDNLPKINTGFAHHGVYSLSYDALIKELTIEIPKTKRLDPEVIGGDTRLPLLPLFFGNTTADNNGSFINVKYDTYDFATGTLKAKFYNSSGTLVDIQAQLGAGSIYFNFKAEVN